ncbi:hypothetical protein KBB17_00790 [Candidatus Saccharibacteria bacterium]|jgi:hypothetical protein|nr:hypothetical protein [Candidatus Saccharibacteria bacterium]MBP9131879.1 hypothetical protein [Candidatus Saccharibacteria bacterium]
MKKLGVLTIHGIGKVPRNYAGGFIGSLKSLIGQAEKDIAFGSIYYQNTQQANEERIWQRYSKNKLDWREARKFLLFGIADATSLEHSKGDFESNYILAQLEIAKELQAIRGKIEPDAPIILIADSLGGHVLSCYIWDAQAYNAKTRRGFNGFWQRPLPYFKEIIGNEPTSKDIAWLQGGNIQKIVTTGCNIPIFVASQAEDAIMPINPPRKDFEWLNYFDRDDVLGWPLQPLSADYDQLVSDIPVKLRGSSLRSRIYYSWNPLVHKLYWSDPNFKQTLVDQIKSSLNQ